MKSMTCRALLAAILLWQWSSFPLLASTVNFGSGGNQFALEFVPIGNPGNPADTTNVFNRLGRGSVAYPYQMGKYEISRDMILKASAEGGLGLTLQDMTSWGGNGGSQPATGVSWNEAARFVNWLNTSQGYSPAYKFAEAPGSGGYNPNADLQLWLPSDPGYNSGNLFRNSLAHYFLPSIDEWYKAAYYDPILGTYYNYATGSDTAPTAVASGTTPGTAVFAINPGPAPITLSGGLSPYGTMGQGGNVYEFEETTVDLLNNNPAGNRGLRGGHFQTPAGFLAADARFGIVPTYEAFVDNGFRVASVAAVPEPSTITLLVLGTAGILFYRGRKLKNSSR